MTAVQTTGRQKPKNLPPIVTASIRRAAADKQHATTPIDRICAQIEAASAEFMAAHRKYADAETAEHKARLRTPRPLRTTERNCRDLPHLTGRGMAPRIAITAAAIKQGIALVEGNHVKVEKTGGDTKINYSDAGFPLTAKETAQIERLRAKLVIAEAFEARSLTIAKRFKVGELDEAAVNASVRQMDLVARLAKLNARSRRDLMTKISAYESELKDFHGSEGEDQLAHSIVRDVVRLTGNSSI